MATNNAAVILPAEGRFYIADTSATKPTTTAVPSAPWTEVGHTSFEDPLVIERDGGDITTLRSWQASALRTSVEGITYKLTFNLLEWDDLAMNLYFGGGAVDATLDEFLAPKTPAAQSKSLFIRLIDGATVTSMYFPTVEIIGSDDIEFDPEELLFLPVTATVIDDADVAYLFTIKSALTVLP
jgi:hypothetical protein